MPVNDHEESRMTFVDPTKLYRKSGGMGHPLFAAPPTLPDTTLSLLPSTLMRNRA
jgi:hypothetical protein